MPPEKPVVIIACRVLQSIIQAQPEGSDKLAIFLEYGLHRTPQLMAPAIQEQIDALPEPSLVLIGYGLCGNGLVGLKAREHTLVIPRADDCIAMFLGSYDAYLQEFSAAPGTYYLTKGWLESGSEPLSQYREYCDKYGPEDADWLLDVQYKSYQRICFVAHSQEDLETYRPRAMEVAEFCRQRWGLRYEERLGSEDFIRRLLACGRTGTPSYDHPNQRGPELCRRAVEGLGEDFVVIPPGGEVRQEQFLRGLSVETA